MKGTHARLVDINKLLADERTHPRLRAFFILLKCAFGSEAEEKEFYYKCINELFLTSSGIKSKEDKDDKNGIENTQENRENKSTLKSLLSILQEEVNVQSGEERGD